MAKCSVCFQHHDLTLGTPHRHAPQSVVQRSKLSYTNDFAKEPRGTIHSVVNLTCISSNSVTSSSLSIYLYLSLSLYLSISLPPLCLLQHPQTSSSKTPSRITALLHHLPQQKVGRDSDYVRQKQDVDLSAPVIQHQSGEGRKKHNNQRLQGRHIPRQHGGHFVVLNRLW